MKFPYYLTQPFTVLWFELDEVIVSFTFIILAMRLSLWFWLIGPVVMVFYMRLKRSKPRGYIRHFFYFVGILKFKGYPTFFEDTFIE